jgi:MFS family permease
LASGRSIVFPVFQFMVCPPVLWSCKLSDLMLKRGIINSFGVFQTYYETDFLHNSSPSSISWIGSMQSFLLLVIGVVSGPLYDMGYLRPLVLGGSTLIILGFVGLSFCSAYWQVFLAQAVCIGIGTGCLYVPSVALLPQYFSSKRALVTGIAASGSSLGGVVYPILFTRLLPMIGFQWTMRAFVLGPITGLLSSILMRPRRLANERSTKPSRRRALIDTAAFKEKPYVLYCVGMFFSCMSVSPIFSPIKVLLQSNNCPRY